MPWVRARLRGQVVYARADAAGALKVENGRVEIRYKPNDGRRYDARPDNLAVVEGAPLPDETCGAAEPVAKSDAAGAKAPATATAKATATRPATRGHGKIAGQHAASVPLAAGTIIAYADGACSGNPGPAGLGVVIIDGDRRVELSEYLGVGTNNIAELTAILRVLQELPEPGRPLVIHTDSQYSIGVLQKGWKAKANTDLVAKVRDAIAARAGTHLRYVPGHSGVPLNERADALAREGVSTRKTRRTELPPKPPARRDDGG